MAVELNHTIVWVTDRDRSASFVAELLGLGTPGRFGGFATVTVANGVTLDYARASGPIAPQHYAFLVGEEDFDAIYGRILQRDMDHWADPQQREPRTINRHDGGRGVYFLDPDGHILEIITRPYGSG